MDLFSNLNSMTSLHQGCWPNRKYPVPQDHSVSLLIWFPGIFFFPLFRSRLPSRLCLNGVSSMGPRTIFPAELIFFPTLSLLHLYLFYETQKFYLALYLSCILFSTFAGL